MKTTIIILSLTLLFTLSTFCQDIIVKKNGREIKGKVVNVTDEKVTYKKNNNQLGPNYYVPSGEVYKIIYENGEVEWFTSHDTIPDQGQDQESLPLLNCEAGFFGTRISDGYRILTYDEIMKRYQGHPRAAELYDAGYRTRIIGNILGIPSAAVFGWCFGRSIAGGHPNNAVYIVSGVAFSISSVVCVAGDLKIRKSVKSYNSDVYGPGAITRIEFGITPNGVGVVLKF